MSNPIERQRQLREAAWEKQRAREEAKKPKLEVKLEGQEEERQRQQQQQQQEQQELRAQQERAEQELRATRLRQAEEARRAESGAPLLKMQRDVVTHLRAAHRPVPLSELDAVVMNGRSIASQPELLTSLRNHVRISVSSDGKFFSYRPKYAVSNRQEMLQLIENSEEGVIATELRESYFEAAADIEALKKEGKVFVLPNKILGSEILFNYYTKYDLEIPPSLKEAWHHVAIADAAKLAAQLMELKLPVAVAPVANKTKYVRKKQKKAVVKGPGRVNDYYNNHVPDAYRDDSWKETLSLDQQMYGKNG